MQQLAINILVKLNLVKKNNSVGAVWVAYTQQFSNNSEIKSDKKSKFCQASLGCVSLITEKKISGWPYIRCKS